jgi:hypothetical protein
MLKSHNQQMMLRENNKNVNRILLFVSITFNIVLAILLYYASGRSSNVEQVTYLDQNSPECTVLFKDDVYQKFFIERDDSTYNEYFSKFFVNTPVQSFMLACTFHVLKPSKEIDRDLKAVLLELKGMYGHAPTIQLKSNVK